MGKKRFDEKKVAPKSAILWMVFITMLWGGSFIFNKIGFREIHPISFMLLRFAIATLLMGILSLRSFPLFNLKLLRKGIIVGSALAATNFTFVLGVQGTTVSRAGFLNNLFVLFVPLICFIFWRERISRITIAGLSLAVAGLFTLARGGLQGFNQGDVLSLVCAFFIALQIIAVSKVLGDEDLYLVTFVQFATVTLFGGVMFFIFASPIHSFGFISLGSLLYCAVFPTVVCFTLQNKYQRYTTPAQAGLIYTLDPIWCVIGGRIILGEQMSSVEWTGCTLILLGVALPIIISRLVERRYLSSPTN